MELKELLWKHFNITGYIGSYLLLKKIEREEILEESEEKANGARIPFRASSCDEKD